MYTLYSMDPNLSFLKWLYSYPNTVYSKESSLPNWVEIPPRSYTKAPYTTVSISGHLSLLMGFLPICAPNPHFQFLRFNSIFYYLVGLDPPHCSFLSFSYLSLHLCFPFGLQLVQVKEKKKTYWYFFIEIYFNINIKERESFIILIYKTLACLFYLINLALAQETHDTSPPSGI